MPQATQPNNATPALGESVEIAVKGRVIARTESVDRGVTYLVEYGRDKRREWFSEDAILEGDDGE